MSSHAVRNYQSALYVMSVKGNDTGVWRLFGREQLHDRETSKARQAQQDRYVHQMSMHVLVGRVQSSIASLTQLVRTVRTGESWRNKTKRTT